MGEATDDICHHVKWKVVVLQRVRKFYGIADIVTLWRSDILSFIEYRTPAIYHAVNVRLGQVDRLQDSFLKDLGLSPLDSLVHFKLAPLSCRRDMALLGLIHRSVLGLGPPQFHEFVRPPWRWRVRQTVRQRHRFHLEDSIDGRHLNLFRDSVFGLMRVYNLLDPEIVEAQSVANFQAKLQQLLLSRACAGCMDWRDTFSPRVAMYEHPLR